MQDALRAPEALDTFHKRLIKILKASGLTKDTLIRSYCTCQILTFILISELSSKGHRERTDMALKAWIKTSLKHICNEFGRDMQEKECEYLLSMIESDLQEIKKTINGLTIGKDGAISRDSMSVLLTQVLERALDIDITATGDLVFWLLVTLGLVPGDLGPV